MCDYSYEPEVIALGYAYGLFQNPRGTSAWVQAYSIEDAARKIVDVAQIFEDYLLDEGDEVDGTN